jgi:hypothetical protein
VFTAHHVRLAVNIFPRHQVIILTSQFNPAQKRLFELSWLTGIRQVGFGNCLSLSAQKNAGKLASQQRKPGFVVQQKVLL